MGLPSKQYMQDVSRMLSNITGQDGVRVSVAWGHGIVIHGDPDGATPDAESEATSTAKFRQTIEFNDDATADNPHLGELQLYGVDSVATSSYGVPKFTADASGNGELSWLRFDADAGSQKSLEMGPSSYQLYNFDDAADAGSMDATADFLLWREAGAPELKYISPDTFISDHGDIIAEAVRDEIDNQGFDLMDHTDLGDMADVTGLNQDHDKAYCRAYNTAADATYINTGDYRTTGEIRGDDWYVVDRVANHWSAEELDIDVTAACAWKFGANLAIDSDAQGVNLLAIGGVTPFEQFYVETDDAAGNTAAMSLVDDSFFLSTDGTTTLQSDLNMTLESLTDGSHELYLGTGAGTWDDIHLYCNTSLTINGTNTVATDTFTNGDGDTVTVTHGLITSIA